MQNDDALDRSAFHFRSELRGETRGLLSGLSALPERATSARLIDIREGKEDGAPRNETTKRANRFSETLFTPLRTTFGGGIFSAFPGIRCTKRGSLVSARGRYINLIRGSRFSRSLKPPRGLSYARTLVSIARREPTCVFAFRPVAHYLWSRLGMMKEPGTSLRNRRTIPPHGR